MTLHELLHEDLAGPTNSAGGGAIAGIGVGPQGEPGVDPNNRYKKSNILMTLSRLKGMSSNIKSPLSGLKSNLTKQKPTLKGLLGNS